MSWLNLTKNRPSVSPMDSSTFAHSSGAECRCPPACSKTKYASSYSSGKFLLPYEVKNYKGCNILHFVFAWVSWLLIWILISLILPPKYYFYFIRNTDYLITVGKNNIPNFVFWKSDFRGRAGLKWKARYFQILERYSVIF